MFSISKQSLYAALIVGAAFFMVHLDGTVIATSLPVMAASLGVDVIDLSLGISAYFIALAVFIPPAGWLADRFGPRRVFTYSIVAFCFASVLCGITDNYYEFVFARIFQGASGAFMIPVGRLILLQLTEKSELSRAMAILTWPAMSAPVVGPVIGGFITTYINWRWNFYINVPLGLLVLLFALYRIPRLVQAPRGTFDWLGFALCSISLVGVLYGVESFAHGWSSAVVSIITLGVGSLFSFITAWYFYRSPKPLLDIKLGRIQTFAFGSLHAGTLNRLSLHSVPFILPLMFQLGFGLTPLQAGGFVMVYFLGNLSMKAFTPSILAMMGFRRLLVVNGLLCAGTLFAAGFISPELGKVFVFCVLFVAGMVRSIQFSGLNTLQFADIPPVSRSSATSIASLMMQVSAALAVVLSVVVMHTSKVLHSRVELSLDDFQHTLWGVAVFIAAGSLWFLKLDKRAGLEVSRYSPK